MQLSAFGSGVPGVSAFCSHLSSEPACFETHLFLPTRHLVCGPAATFATAVVISTRTPHAISFNCFTMTSSPQRPRRSGYRRLHLSKRERRVALEGRGSPPFAPIKIGRINDGLRNGPVTTGGTCM